MIKKIFYCLVFSVVVMTDLPAFAASSQTDGFFILPQYSKRISLDFKDADIKDVLKVFSRQIQTNFVLSSKVEAKAVTVLLENVPVEEALTAVLIANGLVYHYDADSNIFFVDLKDENEKTVTRVYPLKHATVPSSKMLSTFKIAADGSGSSSGSGATTGAVTGSIVDALTPILTGDGKISVDTRTNSLLITDVEANFSNIERALAKLDVPVPQVLIEVEMIDTSKNAVDALGSTFTTNSYFNIAGLTMPINLPLEATLGTPTATITYQHAKSPTEVFDFLTTRADTKSLARPRILTMDNETAQILISTDEVVGLTTVVDANGIATTSAERAQTGVTLTVTPQVNLIAGEITLAISPKVIDTRQSPLSTDTDKFRDAETRGAMLKMKIRDGETVMLGGLLRSSRERSSEKVPFLSKIPFLGRLFGRESKTDIERELLIFITPSIVNNGALSDGSLLPQDVQGREVSGPDRSQAIQSELDRTLSRGRS